MHEMRLVKDLFKDLLGHAHAQRAKKITNVYLKMGEFTEINEEIVRFFFEEKSKDTIAKGAGLSIEMSQNRELRLLSFDYE